VGWYLTWSGDLFQISLAGLIVGQPLVHLPPTVASAVPFLLSAATAAFLTMFLLTRTLSAGRRSTALLMFGAAPYVLLLWWGYWWVPSVFENDPYSTPALLASAVTHWQVVNNSYVVLPMVLIAAWSLIHTHQVWPQWARMGGMLVVGLLSGLGGLVFGVSAIAFVILFWLAISWLARGIKKDQVVEALGFILSTSAGLLIASLSPGAQSRGVILAEMRPLQSSSPWEIFAWVFPQGLFDWFTGIFHLGSLVTVLSSMGIAFGLMLFRVQIPRLELIFAAGGLLAFSLILALAARAGAGFSYVAYWHQVMPRAVSFVALVLLGVAAGSWIFAKCSRSASLVTLSAVVIALAACFGSLYAMLSEIEARHVDWQSGPAPLPGISDIDTDWVGACWREWGSTMELPRRNG
jgi:hypothetical protein